MPFPLLLTNASQFSFVFWIQYILVFVFVKYYSKMKLYTWNVYTFDFTAFMQFTAIAWHKNNFRYLSTAFHFKAIAITLTSITYGCDCIFFQCLSNATRTSNRFICTFQSAVFSVCGMPLSIRCSVHNWMLPVVLTRDSDPVTPTTRFFWILATVHPSSTSRRSYLYLHSSCRSVTPLTLSGMRSSDFINCHFDRIMTISFCWDVQIF